MWRLWVNQSCFSLGLLSQNSLWKLSTFRGYKGLYIVGWERRVSFSLIGWSGDLALQLDWVASSSRELTALPAWDFCPTVQQLAWRFNFWHAWYMCTFWQLASYEPPARSNCESLLLCTILSISSHSLIHYPYMNPT